ncbi:jmjC domain-containing protein 8 [Ditylenchus destructor]|uniref:JmjC domain-containing protein 8 n=1 Tax=Ditylenchus destructor TaxID=166010 RepID=A0AAD4R6M9_9BILA|nr:jmjC domain-containing protein 8 [Ditylenchus destructor]
MKSLYEWHFFYFYAISQICASSRKNDLKDAIEENGGWKAANETQYGMEGPCDIERVDGKRLSQEQFLERYAFSKPVIITNIENDKFQRRCRKEEMLEEWKNAPITLNSANTYSYARVDSTFGDYVQNILKPQDINTPGNETLYLFGDIDQIIWQPLLDEYNQPRWTVPKHEIALSFGIAGAGTGVPFHFHGPGFAEVIHGSKRWFLQPYERKPNFDPDKSTLHWYLNDYPMLPPEEKPLECVLKPNELIFFPDKWWHATLNAETSVFISTFLSPIVPTKNDEL